MCKLFIIMTFLGSAFLISCNHSPSEQNMEKENEFLEKELELTKKELELSRKEHQIQEKQESKTKKQEKSASVETKASVTSSTVQNDPVKIMQLIFEVAKTNDFNRLYGLCDPTGSGDSDTKLICNVGSQSIESQKEFKEYFQNGRVIGTAIIIGNSAIVKFKFGPDGNKDEQMNFVQIGEKWYLSSY